MGFSEELALREGMKMFPNWMLYLLELACHNDCSGSFEKFCLQCAPRKESAIWNMSVFPISIFSNFYCFWL